MKLSFKGSFKKNIIILIISLICSILILLGALFFSKTNNCFVSADKLYESSFFNWRNPVFKNFVSPGPISIINIDEKSLQKLGTWPIRRNIYAKLINLLESAQVKTIGLDIFFPEKSNYPEDDLKLAETIKQNKNVIIASNFIREKNTKEGEVYYSEKLQLPADIITEIIRKNLKNQVGFVSVEEDPDGIIRRAFLYKELSNKSFFSFDVLLIADFLNAPLEIKLIPQKNSIVFNNRTIPVDNQGCLKIDYGLRMPAGEEESSVFKKDLASQFIDIFSMTDVLEMNLLDLKKAFKDKLVLVGTTATAGFDTKNTPLGNMPGVYVHLNTLLTLLEEKFIYTPSIAYQIIWITFWGILIGFFLPHIKPKQSIFLLILTLGASFLASYLLFAKKGIMLPNFLTQLNIVISFISTTGYRLYTEHAAQTRLSTLFKEFAPLPSKVLEDILGGSKEGAALGGVKRNLTILFSDIRGYTDLSEKLDPVTVMDTLNEYHQSMGEIFQKNGAIIFDYQGDAQMVVFGLMEPSAKNHAYYAVKAALAMQEKLSELRGKWQKEGKHTFQVGVGICTGDVSLGIVGSDQRKQYAAIGDSTNVAARLQGMSLVLESPVLVSESTYQMAKDYLETDKLEPVKLKGKSEPLQVYRAKGVREIASGLRPSQ